MRDILLYFSCIHNGDWHSIYKSVKALEKADEVKLKEFKEKITSNYITILDDNYPEILKSCINPPYVLFYRGDISLLSNINNIAVIGSRQNTYYGFKMTEKIVIDLVKRGYTIVSGMAKGIDSIAHKTCLKEKGKTIAVVGSGLDFTYPKENLELQKEIEQNGLIISEYPDFVVPKAYHYPNRNRIIACLSNAIVVTEAKVRSGTLITVRYGLECGKEIFAVPYLANGESGCNLLIKEGAQLVENVDDMGL